jgi:hypothetical protein
MGEYVIHANDTIKLGKLDVLYYTNYEKYLNVLKRGRLKKDVDSNAPLVYALPESKYYFRFPFPDEEKFRLGDIGDFEFNRTISFTIDRPSFLPEGFFPPVSKYEKDPDSPRYINVEYPNPNNQGTEITLEIEYQKAERHNGGMRLLFLIQCPFCKEMWGIRNTKELNHLGYSIYKKYVIGKGSKDEKEFWRKMITNIYRGYQEPHGKILDQVIKNHKFIKRLRAHRPATPLCLRAAA